MDQFVKQLLGGDDLNNFRVAVQIMATMSAEDSAQMIRQLSHAESQSLLESAMSTIRGHEALKQSDAVVSPSDGMTQDTASTEYQRDTKRRRMGIEDRTDGSHQDSPTADTFRENMHNSRQRKHSKQDLDSDRPKRGKELISHFVAANAQSPTAATRSVNSGPNARPTTPSDDQYSNGQNYSSTATGPFISRKRPASEAMPEAHSSLRRHPISGSGAERSPAQRYSSINKYPSPNKFLSAIKNGIEPIQLPYSKLERLANPRTVTFDQIPGSMRQLLPFNVENGRVNPKKYGIQTGNSVNGGWCFVELLTKDPCPKGTECLYSHCPPDAATRLFLLQLGTEHSKYGYVARNFLFNVLKYYNLKYYRRGSSPTLSNYKRSSGVQLTAFPRDAPGLSFAFSCPPSFFEGHESKPIMTQWDKLNELQALKESAETKAPSSTSRRSETNLMD